MIYIDMIQQRSYSKTRTERTHWSWSKQSRNAYFRKHDDKSSMRTNSYSGCSYSFSRTKFGSR